jgi:hypothetical protein
MRRMLLLAALVVLGMPGRGWAQPRDRIDDLYGEETITEEDRQRIRTWVRARAANLVASTDPELKQMVAARREIVVAGRTGSGRSQAFLEAFGEEAVAALTEAGTKAVSQEARLNLVMTVAGLENIEALPLLLDVLTKDPYAASRYWAAKGVAMVTPRVIEKVLPGAERQIIQGVDKAFDAEASGFTLNYLFEILGRFDREDSHDVLATGAARVAMRLKASDPAVARALGLAVRSLRDAYARDARPEAKTRILTTYALLCAWIMPPVADPNLMVSVNAALEEITNEGVGFSAGFDQEMQKMALMEWIERLVRLGRIPKRPPLPPAIEKAVEAAKGETAPEKASGVTPPKPTS